MPLSQQEQRRLAEEQLLRATDRVQALLADATFREHDELSKLGIKILRRPDPEVKMDVFRAHGVIRRPLDELFEVVSHNENRIVWDKSYRKERSRVIDEWYHDELQQVVYYHDVQDPMLGGLISARDICSVRYARKFEREAMLVFTAAEGDLQVPLLPNSVRAWLHPSAIHIKSIGPSDCEIAYLLHPDPRGHIPSWAVSKAIGQTLGDQVRHWSTHRLRS